MTATATSPTRADATDPGISWGWLLALGLLMTALGVIGLGMTIQLTVVAVFWFGVLTIAGGTGQLLDAFHHKGWGAIVWHVLIALLYIAAGIVLVAMPLRSAWWLTLLTAAALVAIGVARIVMSFSMRNLGAVWIGVLLSGIISVALGVMIYTTVAPPSPEVLATPEGQLAFVQSWGWVIGLFVAIELLMEGLGLIFVSLAARRHAAARSPSTGAPAAA